MPGGCLYTATWRQCVLEDRLFIAAFTRDGVILEVYWYPPSISQSSQSVSAQRNNKIELRLFYRRGQRFKNLKKKQQKN